MLDDFVINRDPKPLYRQVINRLLHLLARYLPGISSTRVFLHKLRGVKINGKPAIGADVYIDDAFPEDIEINDGAQISIRAVLVSHFRGRGKIIIGKNAFIGPHSVILKNVEIGEGAVVMAGSVVNKNVPPFTMVGGAPSAIPLAKSSCHLGYGKDFKTFMLSLKPLEKG